MIIALTTAARSQTLSLLRLSNMTVTEDGFRFGLINCLSKAEPGYVTPTIYLQAYTLDNQLCVCVTLTEY